MAFKTGSVFKYIRQSADFATMAALSSMTVLVFFSVIQRYIFSITYRWSDELIRIIFTYLVFLGIPVAYRHGDHVAISFFASLLPEKIHRWLKLVIHIVVAITVLVVAGYGLDVVTGKLGRALTPGIQIPRAYVYAAMPIGTFFLLLEIIDKLRESVREIRG
jgi:TRAP-type transport system small permease protein